MFNGLSTMETMSSSPTYEVGDNFDDVAAVGAIIVDPLGKRILLVRRLDEETEKKEEQDKKEGKEIDKSRKNKVDLNGHIILALPSGSGPLKDDSTKPDLAVIKEIMSETGGAPASLKRFHTYKRIDALNAKKIGFYVAEMSPDSISPTNPNKDWPGWFPIEWFGTKIILPYAEHNQVVLDYLKESAV